ncbi:PAS domain-containing protein cky-1 [Neocloeon triangulifer]|uniref:PAS domain-containing protein cky-1 n=1 Tax=Neocloeon triangulifer TaxID=2078957 RepID=UPI00286EF6C3|nr:PAS domain-containing protein cky-1 [Neocloeon triangulifer]
MTEYFVTMCSFDSTKSTKGASKLRRDLINSEIANLRDLLPLPPSTRQRLSQLQLMALVCVYVRKANYFTQVFKRQDLGHFQTPNIGFSKALSGFLMMMTQNGKLLYISDNAAEYLGHSMEDLLIHGDSVFDIIDKQDHASIQAELSRATNSLEDEERLFLCRMNVSRNARRQMRFGDQKVVLVQGHFLHLPPSLCPRQQPVFLARCTPIAMPETRECVVQGSTSVFTTVHAMDMRFLHVDVNGEFHLGFQRRELLGASWYQLLHWESLRDAQGKHRLITQSEQEKSCILLVRLQRKKGDWVWLHCVLQVKDSLDHTQQGNTQTHNSPVIVCTNQVLSDREAVVMRANPWLYQYYTVHSKLQFGLTAYEAPQQASRLPTTPMSGNPNMGQQPYYANTGSGPATPISGLNTSHHLGSGLTSYDGGGYVHQTHQNPDSPLNQNLERSSYLNINNIFNLSLSKTFASKATLQSYEELGGSTSLSTSESPDNEAALRAHSYGCYSENGVTLTVLRPTPGITRSRKFLATNSYHELSPPYSSNESSPVQKVPDVDVFNFDKSCEQSVPGSPGLYRVSPITRNNNHLIKPPLTPEETTTSESEAEDKKDILRF